MKIDSPEQSDDGCHFHGTRSASFVTDTKSARLIGFCPGARAFLIAMETFARHC